MGKVRAPAPEARSHASHLSTGEAGPVAKHACAAEGPPPGPKIPSPAKSGFVPISESESSIQLY